MAKIARLLSYNFQPAQNRGMQAGLRRFTQLIQPATQAFLAKCWKQDLFDQLAAHPRIPAYKFLDVAQIGLQIDGQAVYFPNRIKRGIAEVVGRTIRSQIPRKRCFEAIQPLLEIVPIDGPLRRVTAQINRLLRDMYGLCFNWNLLKQILQMIRRWTLKYYFDLSLLDYACLVTPQMDKTFFSYAPDDDQAVQYQCTRRTIYLQLRLPKIAVPTSLADWSWYSDRIRMPLKIRRRLRHIKDWRPRRPLLREIRTKGGIRQIHFQFAWDYAKILLNYQIYHKKRVLAVDLGLVNVATFVVCEAGRQLTAPQFLKAKPAYYQRIERRYQLIQTLQKKLARFPDNYRGQARRRQEVSRIHAKLQRCRRQGVYRIINEILLYARLYGCVSIIIEDLSQYEPPKGKHKLSRRLSNWIRGLFASSLEHKAQCAGLTVIAVDPAYTSSLCPRCGRKGEKIQEPDFHFPDKAGRYFYCPHCQFGADRDYVGALNVYRRYLVDLQIQKIRQRRRHAAQKQRKAFCRAHPDQDPPPLPKIVVPPMSLFDAIPVLYTRTPVPANRLAGMFNVTLPRQCLVLS